MRLKLFLDFLFNGYMSFKDKLYSMHRDLLLEKTIEIE